MALSITSSNSLNGQANTQSPQTSAGSGAPPSAPSSSVQPGTATSLLSTQSNGIALNNQALTTVNLNAVSSQTQQPQAQAVPTKHHLNPVLLGLAIVLFVLAIIFFWTTSRSGKNAAY